MDEPALLVPWERAVGEPLDRTAGFPKEARFTFAARPDGRALDILECLAEALFAPAPVRAARLADADRHLADQRVLLRVSHERRYLSTGQLAHLSRRLDEAGRMLGGWRAWLAEHAE